MFIGFWMGVLCFATQIIVGGEQDTNSPVDLNFKKTPQPVFIKEITLSPEDRSPFSNRST